MNVERTTTQTPVRPTSANRNHTDSIDEPAFVEILQVEMPAPSPDGGEDTSFTESERTAPPASDQPADDDPQTPIDPADENQSENANANNTSTSESGSGPDRGSDGPHNPDPRQEQTVDFAKSVDGSGKGFRPGASTEATVSALAIDRPAHAPQATAPAGELSPLKLTPPSEPPSPPAESTPMPKNDITDKLPDNPAPRSEPTPLTAKVVSASTSISNWAALGQKGVVFETGLAEQVIRAVVDKFEDPRSSNASRTPTRIAPAVSASTAQPAPTDRPVFANTFDTTLIRATQPEPAPQGNIDRVLTVVRNNVGQRHSQLTVQLDPPELGRLKIDVRLSDNHMRLTITTDTAQARQVITERFDVLRSALESQGVTVSRFDVHTRPSTSQHQPQQHHTWDNPSGHQGQAFTMHDHHRQSSEHPKHYPNPAFDLDEPESKSTNVLSISQAQPTQVNLVA